VVGRAWGGGGVFTGGTNNRSCLGGFSRAMKGGGTPGLQGVAKVLVTGGGDSGEEIGTAERTRESAGLRGFNTLEMERRSA